MVRDRLALAHGVCLLCGRGRRGSKKILQAVRTRSEMQLARAALPSPIWLLTSGGHWHFGVGDPNPMGWAIFAAYFAVAAICYRAGRTSLFGAQKLAGVAPSEAQNQRRLALWWLGVCVGMALLGLNKQLDLQTLLIDMARSLAETQGWYEQRWRAKKAFLVALALGAGTLGIGLAYAMRRVLPRIALSFLGLCTLALFILVRAAQFEHLTFLRSGARPVLTWGLELGGIILVGLGAHRASVPVGSATA